jgi:hypothetical protein
MAGRASLIPVAAAAMCCQAVCAQAPLLPAAAGPVIRKPAQPSHFLESVGRRAAILGNESGTFEAWLNPVKVLRDFRLSVYFDGALEPVDLGGMAERVTVSPGRATIIHSHAAFTIRQTWVASLADPVLLVLLEIDTNRPLRLRASFVPEMKPMWPAGFGGQNSSWDDTEKAFVLTEGLRRFTILVGSPRFTIHSEQIGHQLPARGVLAEMDLTPEICRAGAIPIVIAGSPAAYHAALADPGRILRESDDYYRSFDARTLHIETPDTALNDAIQWGKFALEKGWACNEGVGCGLVAGYGPSGESERPGFAWYFGGDALMNSWSIVDYGDFARARALLEFLRDHQRTDGKMEHELTQSAALLDWSKYPYGYFHADTTPLYLYSTWRYVSRSGDLDFLKASWPSLEKAWNYCLSVLDDGGLLSNRKAGAGAVETGALSGRVANDIYLQGVWMAAIEAYSHLAKAAGKPAGDADTRLERARNAVNGWFVDSKDTFAFARLTDGSMYEAQSGWQGLALALGGLDPAKAGRAAARLAKPELTTDWGTRLFATDSPYYDPLSYNDGSVWPFVTAFDIMAEYRWHQPRAALRHLHGVAAMLGLTGAGFIPEYMSGERAQALPHAVPHQLFSSSAVLYTTVSGMLGMEGDAATRALILRPHLPQGWTVRFDGYRLGKSLVSGSVERLRGEARVSLRIEGEPLAVVFAPAFSRGAAIESADLNGARAPVRTESSTADLHAELTAPAAARVEARIRANEPAEAPPVLTNPEPGEPARR